MHQIVCHGGCRGGWRGHRQKILSFDGGNDEDDDQKNFNISIQESVAQDDVVDVVPKEGPSPLPLSAEWIEQELKDAEKGKKAKPPPPVVKDLDSKIEMLRAREELAKADAERKRIEDIEKAEQVRKQDQVEIEAQIAAAAEKERLMEQERAERIKRERAERERKEREERLTELEQGKREQRRLEMAKRDSVKGVVNGNVEKARQQPKSPEEERDLKEKYGSMDLEERAFNILVDLGMVDLHSDPDSSLDWDEDDESNAFM